MKTTIKTGPDSSIVVAPSADGISLFIVEGGRVIADKLLTQDQAGALMFGLEVAAEVAEAIDARKAKAA